MTVPTAIKVKGKMTKLKSTEHDVNYKMAIRLLACLFLTAVSFAQAQQSGKISRIGVLLYGTPENDPNVAAFRQNMRDLGYTEGKNLSVEYRFAGGNPNGSQKLPPNWRKA